MTVATMPFRSGPEMWADRVAKSGDGLAFKYKKNGAWVDVSWRRANEQAREIAGGLISLGIRAGDRVCILAQTRYEWMIADLGVLVAGAATVPIYPSSTPEQCAYIVTDCGARAVIVEDAAQLEKILPLLGKGDLRVIYMQGDAPLEKPDARGRTRVTLDEALAAAPAGTASAIVSWEALAKSGAAFLPSGGEELERRTRGLGPDDLFTIIYTSGTTGAPKGVVLTHGNLISALASACRALTLHDDDLQYLWLTMAHVLGREIAWAVIFVGAPTAFTEGLTKIKDNLLEVHPTFMAGVPRVYEKFYGAVKAGMNQGSGVKKALVRWAMGVGTRCSQIVREGGKPTGALAFQHKLADKLVFSKLRAKLGLERCRFLISGGAPLAAEIAEFFHAVGLLILEGYGLTETMAAAFVNRLEAYRFGTVGPAIDVVECKIADDGEILMRGPSVFKEYYKNPEATAEALDADGWFHSGDIGHLEAGGLLRITDRKKDIIVTAVGKKVAPQMLENALKARSQLVSQAMVYGDKRPYCVALVTLSEEAVKRFGDGDGKRAAGSGEAKAEVQKTIEAVNAGVASFEQIKRFAILPQDFSEAAGDLTPSLKVKRKVVIERNRALIDGLYAGTVD